MSIKDWRKQYIKFNDHGFTLVEVTVVIVILVIVATITIPAFSKYFSTKYDEKIVDEAKSIKECSQILINELYAKNSHNTLDGTTGNNKEVCFIEGLQDTSGSASEHPKTFRIFDEDNKNVDIHWNPLSAEILSLAGMNIKENNPCIVIIGTGRYDIYADPMNQLYDPEKAYTVYYVAYQSVFKEKFVYISGDKISNQKPLDKVKYNGKDVNHLKVDDEDIYIQLYALKCGKDNKDWITALWQYMK